MTRFRLPLVPLVALATLTAHAQNVPMTLPNLVTAYGNAEAKMAPDMATIRIGVETLGKTAKEAQSGTSALANRLIAAALGIVPDRKSFQTSDLSLYPEYAPITGGGGLGGGLGGGPMEPQTPKIVGYRARNILTIRLDDVTKVGPLVDAVTEAGATNVDSISFGLKSDKAARRQALMDAVREARDKAQAMAQGLGLKLGDVYSVDEGVGATVRPFEMANVARFKDAGTPVMPGEVSLSASVTVRFVIYK